MKDTTSTTYYVSGMHCASCELLLEKKLKRVQGVNGVKASLSGETVEITHEKGATPSLKKLNDSVKEQGYELTQTRKTQSTFNPTTIFHAVSTFLVLGVIYLVFRDLGILAQFNITSSSALPAFFTLGIAASLSSCAALVGGILLSMSQQWVHLYKGEDMTHKLFPFAMFNAGRLLSFALLGGLLGLVGSFFQLSITATALLTIAASFVMLVVGLQMLGIPWVKKIQLGTPRFISRYTSNEENFQGKYMPFTVGALTFFLPCGFTLMAQTVALTTGDFVTSALMMFIFALGTLPMLGLLSWGSVSFLSKPQFVSSFNVIVGTFLLIFSIYNANGQLNILNLPSLNDITTTTPKASANEITSTLISEGGEEVQLVEMQAEGFEYYPRSLVIKAGVKTRLTVTNTNVVGCAQAMWMGGLYDDVVYLNQPQAQVEFIPQPGVYKISCTMGMVNPVIVEVLEP